MKNFPLGPGYLIEGEPVEIVAPVAAKEPKRTISRSGSIAVKNAPARVARAPASGLKVCTTPSSWRRSGATICALRALLWSRCTAWMISPVLFASSRRPGRRLGILVDHLIEGTKEQRIVADAMAVPGAAGHVKIVGHPFIDIWQAVKPSVLGLKVWPQVPRGEDFKKGTLRRLGQPHETQADVAQAWEAHSLPR